MHVLFFVDMCLFGVFLFFHSLCCGVGFTFGYVFMFLFYEAILGGFSFLFPCLLLVFVETLDIGLD